MSSAVRDKAQAMSVRPTLGGGLRRHDAFGPLSTKRLAMLMQYTMAKALIAIPLHRHPGEGRDPR